MFVEQVLSTVSFSVSVLFLKNIGIYIFLLLKKVEILINFIFLYNSLYEIVFLFFFLLIFAIIKLF